MVKCNLELTEQQSDIVMKALELYSRIATGQVSAILTHPAIEDLDSEAYLEAEKALGELKKAVFPYLKESGDAMSLRNEQVAIESKNAYDIMQSMKHQFALADPKGNHSVWRFEPRPAGNQQLPICRLQ